MFDKIKSIFQKEEFETVPLDADDNWEPKGYDPVVDPYSDSHEGDYS